MSAQPQQPQLQLNTLQAAGLIRLAQTEPEIEYRFRHALTQEAAYTSMLKSQRRDLHQSVAEAIELVYADRLDALDDVLAFHWERAESPSRARRYLFRAGQDAARRYAHPEALDLFGRALAMAEGAPPAETLAIYEARAHIYELLSQNPEALADNEAALALARQANLLPDECRILARIAWLHWLCGEGARAIEVARQAQLQAQSLQDNAIALRAFLVIGLVAQAEGRMAEAHTCIRRALYASRECNERALEGESLFYLGIQNNFMGRFGRAAACARKAYDIKRDLGDPVGEIVSLFLKTRAEAGRANYDAALDALEAAHTVSRETHNLFGLAQYPNTRAWLHAELGDWETAYGFDRAGLEVSRAAPVRPPEIGTLLNLVLDCVALGKYDEAETYLDQVQGWLGRPEFGFHAWRWETRHADARARLLLAQSRYSDASEAVGRLLGWAACTQARKYLARGLLLRGKIHLAQGALPAAEADFVSARELADVMCYWPIRHETRCELSRVLTQTGDDAGASQMHHEITQLVDSLDRSLKHPELRHSFERGLSDKLSRESR
jgi:tetratricopeptide (TPR) repeat protein